VARAMAADRDIQDEETEHRCGLADHEDGVDLSRA